MCFLEIQKWCLQLDFPDYLYQSNIQHQHLSWLQEYAKKNDILIIFDEIQTGFGKTGTFFSYEHMNIIPDILIMGKGMSNGFGISALLTHKDIVSNMDTSALAGGSADNDFFCSVVNTVFDLYEEEKILEHVNEMHEYVVQTLTPILSLKNAKLQGNGLFMSVVFEDANLSSIISYCREKRIFFGKSEKSIMIRPPLVITKDELQQALTVLIEAVQLYA